MLQLFHSYVQITIVYYSVKILLNTFTILV